MSTQLEVIEDNDDMENVLLELMQQAQEVVIHIEESEYSNARELLSTIESRLQAVSAYVQSLENGGK